MVSPRKSLRKSACFSRTSTSTPARASRNPNISPAGPPPAMQQRTWMVSVGEFSEDTRNLFQLWRGLGLRGGLRLGFPSMAGVASDVHLAVREIAGVDLLRHYDHVARDFLFRILIADEIALHVAIAA